MGKRLFHEKTLVVASHNDGKVVELRDLLTQFNISIKSSKDFKLEEPEETGKTFIENAIIKSEYTAKKTGLPSLSDDSGLVIPALNGDPGIYSARWAGPKKDFAIACNRIEKELKEKTGTIDNHKAYFVCALAISWPDGHTQDYEGKVYGKLVFPSRGARGFGYDPIFIPNGYEITFGEMSPNIKHMISHRADAFKKFVDDCFEK